LDKPDGGVSGGTGLSRQARRWWAIGGSVLLAALVLVAVFSLGVYVGRQGWGTEAPGMGQMQGPAPPGQQPPAPPVWPQARPALEGMIRSVGPEGILVESPQGARFVRIIPETRFARLTDRGEVEVGREALRPGLPVNVFGPLAPDGRTLTAERIVLLPQR